LYLHFGGAEYSETRMSIVLTEEHIKELLKASVNLIVQNILFTAVQETKKTFCTACPTPCDDWCDKATEITNTLINHYLKYKARFN